jgi:nicotinamidase-related amidase
MLLNRKASALLVIDVQERLAPAVAEHEAVVERINLLLEAGRRLDVPILVSEQYPRGLGSTLPELRPHLEGAEVVAKTSFSCAREPELAAALQRTGRKQTVVCGMETHVCVLQTAIDLKDQGYEVFVVADAVGSRDPKRRELGLARMRDAGCTIVDSEMVLFEWLGGAGTDEFRALSRLIR